MQNSKNILAITIGREAESVFKKILIHILKKKYTIKEVFVENFVQGFSIFLKERYSFLVVTHPNRWIQKNRDSSNILARCIEVLEDNEHYAVCQPAIIYGRLEKEYIHITKQKKTHTYLKFIDDSYLVVKGNVANNFSPGHFIQDGKMDWNSYIKEINFYGYESLRICKEYLEVKKLYASQNESKNILDSVDLINQIFSKKHFDVGIDLSSLDPIFNGTSEYAIGLLDGLVDKLKTQNISFQIIANNLTIEKFKLEKYKEYIVESNLRGNSFYKILFIPQQIFSLNTMEIISQNCLKYIFTMLDAIALRCKYISEKISIDISSSIAFRFSENILSISKSSASDIESYFAERRIDGKVLPILLTKEAKCKESEVQNAPEFNERNYVLIIGNGFKHKALERTLNELSDTKLKVVVIADERIREKFGKSFQIFTSGRLSEKLVDILYANSRLILYPSLYEGFGLPVLGAIQLGKPILVYNSDVNRELKKEFDRIHCIHFFDTFSELSGKLQELNNENIENYKPNSVNRKWKDVGEETAGVIIKNLKSNIDFDRINERILSMKELKKIQDSLPLHHLKNFKTLLKFVIQIIINKLKNRIYYWLTILKLRSYD
ncbi:MAG: glycosyltransferase [Leptospiraceae bacterium]|nr:glycosyltransferase [Leptospiraceae bacterium]